MRNTEKQRKWIKYLLKDNSDNYIDAQERKTITEEKVTKKNTQTNKLKTVKKKKKIKKERSCSQRNII